jgi:hypothetical protein
MADEPQIIELDPEGSSRMSAVILLVCGLMGVGFLLVNVVFTGEDPYATQSWPEPDDGNIQEQGNITPNLWRNRGNDDEEEAVEERVVERKKTKPKSTTNPYGLPNPLNRPGVPTVTPAVPVVPKTSPGGATETPGK